MRRTEPPQPGIAAAYSGVCAICGEWYGQGEACLEYALEHHVEGIWAGTTFGQRRRLRTERRVA